jgi:hypothetical protein
VALTKGDPALLYAAVERELPDIDEPARDLVTALADLAHLIAVVASNQLRHDSVEPLLRHAFAAADLAPGHD